MRALANGGLGETMRWYDLERPLKNKRECITPDHQSNRWMNAYNSATEMCECIRYF